jgi:LPXTG-site transpeptidase (sortase) family protein
MSGASSALKWLEGALLAIGLALGAWVAMVFIEARHVDRMPVPAPAALHRLPGEDASEGFTPRRRDVARGEWLARLEAPALDFAATVLEGTDDRTLRRGAGHIEYTPLPGEPGNIGIAGHRDTAFRPLRNAKAGDRLTMTTAARVFDYRVVETLIVNPDDVEVLDPTGNATLTLVTCYPFNFIGSAPKRFIVRAELVAETPR